MRKYAFAAIPLILLVSCIIQLACGGGGGITTPPAVYNAAYAPRNVQGDVGNERLFLSWDPVPYAVGYKVYISTDGAKFNLYSGEGLVPSTSVVIADVSNTQVYYLGVSAVGSSGVETAISYPGGAPDAVPLQPQQVIVNPLEGPPSAPKNLQGIAGDRHVRLDWDANTEADLKDYQVSRRPESVTVFYDIPGITVNHYDDTEVENGRTYYYYVKARDIQLLLSDPSNMVKLTPKSAPPAAPTGFTAIYAFVQGGDILNWDKETVEPDVVKFRIIRYDVTDDFIDPLLDTSIVTLDYPKTADPYNPGEFIFIPPFVDRFVESGHKYMYELAGIDIDNQIGAASLSNVVEIP